MSATAISVMINDDLTIPQLKMIMTNRTNILVSLSEVSEDPEAPIGLRFDVLAEVEDVEMLRDILVRVLSGITTGEEVYAGMVKHSESENLTKRVFAEFAAKKAEPAGEQA